MKEIVKLCVFVTVSISHAKAFRLRTRKRSSGTKRERVCALSKAFNFRIIEGFRRILNRQRHSGKSFAPFATHTNTIATFLGLINVIYCYCYTLHTIFVSLCRATLAAETRANERRAHKVPIPKLGANVNECERAGRCETLICSSGVVHCV